METEQDYYQTLQVHPGASQEVIRAAYRALAQRYHPDNAGPAGEAKMVEINVAYEILGDAERRAEYDRDRAAGRWGTGSSTGGSRSGSASGGAAWTAPASGPASKEPFWVGSAGPPPGRPSGSVLLFGRFKGWSLGEIVRIDPGYLEWLEGKPEGRKYLDEIDELLVKTGFRHRAKRSGGASGRR
jgi:curved DNA-binding protein CbpA